MPESRIKLPDIGGFDKVEIIEVLVSPGDSIEAETPLLTLESDKASMEIPSPVSGTVAEILVKVGDKISEGDDIVVCQVDESASAQAEPQATATNGAGSGHAGVAGGAGTTGATGATGTAGVAGATGTAGVAGHAGATGTAGAGAAASGGARAAAPAAASSPQSPTTASSTPPAPPSGSTAAASATPPAPPSAGSAVASHSSPSSSSSTASSTAPSSPSSTTASSHSGRSAPSTAPAGGAPAITPDSVYASPSVRKLARSLGADLTQVASTGARGRILGEDIHAFVRDQLGNPPATAPALFEGLEPLAPIDFTKFGPTRTEELSRINQLTATAMSRSWLSAPHVTQFDEADIGALEQRRKQLNVQHKNDGIKFTFLAFLIRAVTVVLKEMPRFNSSLDAGKKTLTIKDYYHIGIAVDTPAGLVVPVLRDADKKSVKEIAVELAGISARARARKLPPKELQGGTFTISSLGGIGGTAFTPVINLPEVAILGVARSQIKPHWDGNKFIPVSKLPLCLSYDHRVIDGAAAARFTTALANVLADPTTVLD